MRRETDYRGPRSLQKNTRKENFCSFQMLLYHRSLQKNPSERGRERARERERKSFCIQGGELAVGRRISLFFSVLLSGQMWELASSLWESPEESSRPSTVGKTGGWELADMCFFFSRRRGGVSVRWFMLPKLLGISFTLSNLCCLKVKRGQKKSCFPSLSSSLRCVIFNFS